MWFFIWHFSIGRYIRRVHLACFVEWMADGGWFGRGYSRGLYAGELFCCVKLYNFWTGDHGAVSHAYHSIVMKNLPRNDKSQPYEFVSRHTW